MADVRIDKWLWAVRFFKTRALAKAAVISGKVKRAGQLIKPSANVQVDDLLSIQTSHERYEVVVLEVIQSRVGASIARACYEETAASVQARERIRLAHQLGPKLNHRPDKRQRRQIQQFKHAQSDNGGAV